MSKSTLASRMRKCRNKKGWSQEALAGEAQCQAKLINNIEGGRSLLPRKIEHIAAALGTTPSYLLFGVVDEKEKKAIAVQFFNWYWDQPGTDVEQGFDEWMDKVYTG